MCFVIAAGIHRDGTLDVRYNADDHRELRLAPELVKRSADKNTAAPVKDSDVSEGAYVLHMAQ